VSDFHSYSPSEGHGLKHNPFKALITPRPIGWISTCSAAGAANLAPYSYFNALCDYPPLVGFVSAGMKDSLTNILETGEFVHNLVPHSLAEKMNETSGNFEHGVSEIDAAGLLSLKSDLVRPHRLADSPAAMECKLVETKVLAGLNGEKTQCTLVIGEVVRIHIHHSVIRDGLVDEARMALVGRLGYFNYVANSDVFVMKRPII
jgi:flavin reductase (DIM6/NTAB) family NADH-FMN oxidoreductase RutF